MSDLLVIPVLFDKQLVGFIGWAGFSVCVIAAVWQYGKEHGWGRTQKYTACGACAAVLVLVAFLLPLKRPDVPAAGPHAMASHGRNNMTDYEEARAILAGTSALLPTKAHLQAMADHRDDLIIEMVRRLTALGDEFMERE